MPSRSTPERNFSAPPTLHREVHAAAPAAGLLVAVHAHDGGERRAGPGKRTMILLGAWQYRPRVNSWSTMRIGRLAAGVLLHRAVIGEHDQRGLGGGPPARPQISPPPTVALQPVLPGSQRCLGNGCDNQERAKDQSVSEGSHGLSFIVVGVLLYSGTRSDEYSRS